MLCCCKMLYFVKLSKLLKTFHSVSKWRHIYGKFISSVRFDVIVGTSKHSSPRKRKPNSLRKFMRFWFTVEMRNWLKVYRKLGDIFLVSLLNDLIPDIYKSKCTQNICTACFIVSVPKIQWKQAWALGSRWDELVSYWKVITRDWKVEFYLDF